MAVEALDLGDVSLVFLDGIGVSICCRGVVAITTLLVLVPRTSLVLVFPARLVLVGGKLLVLTTRYVSKGSDSGLSHSGVFLLLFCRLVSLKAP